jgi:hypothetical protein
MTMCASTGMWLVVRGHLNDNRGEWDKGGTGQAARPGSDTASRGSQT